MPAFIHLPCSCGRTVRAKADQAGTAVKCWGCGTQIVVPMPRVAGRLFEAFSASLRTSLGLETLFKALGIAFLLALGLTIPYAGRWLGLVFALMMAVLYQDLIRAAGEGKTGEPVGLGSLFRKDCLLRWLLGVLAIVALFAPLYFRNWGHLLPGRRTVPIERTLMFVSFISWLIVPLILLAFNAHDGAGRLRSKPTLAILIYHPWATLSSLLIFPAGLLVVEWFLVIFSWYENLLPVFVGDLFPTPLIAFNPDGAPHLVFYYDLFSFERTAIVMMENAFPDYLRAVRHGFFLTGTLPESLATGFRSRIEPELFYWSKTGYFIARFIFAILTLAATGTLLAIQARWLGLITGIGSSRPSLAHSDSHKMIVIPEEASPSQSLIPIEHATRSHDSSAVSVQRSSPEAFPAGVIPSATSLAPRSASVPLIAVSYPVVPVESNGASMTSFVAGRSTILIIDDELTFAHAIGKILADRGFAVVVAGDGNEGLRLSRTCHPDLIILDLLLPDHSGMEICQQLRAQEATRETPIVVASYKSGAEDEIGALAHGADDFLGKPYAVEVLIARVEKQLQRRKLRTV